MANEFNDDLHIETDNDSDLVKQLRKALKAKNDELSKANQKVETYEKKSRASTLADILTEKKVPAKAAALIPADVEATPEGVAAWLADFGDVFGVAQESTEEPKGSEPEAGSLSDEDKAALAQVQRTESRGQSDAPVGSAAVTKQLADIKALPAEEAFAELRKLGLVGG